MTKDKKYENEGKGGCYFCWYTEHFAEELPTPTPEMGREYGAMYRGFQGMRGMGNCNDAYVLGYLAQNKAKKVLDDIVQEKGGVEIA